MKKLSVSQVRSLVRSQLNEAIPSEIRFDDGGVDKYYFTEIQDAINACQAHINGLEDDLRYLQSLTQDFDPEFEFDANEAAAMLIPLEDHLSEYADAVDQTAEIVVDQY